MTLFVLQGYKLSKINKLLSLTQRLRDPILGCEWDKVQTFESLKPYTLEEAYEVLDAIDRQDLIGLKEELGDLLFHIVFYSELAKDANYFDFDDVCESVVNKLVYRHPHVFAEQKTEKPNWEQLKQHERDKKQQYSFLDDIPHAFPALMRAEKIQKRCASVGFDWDNIESVVDKVKEELDELVIEIQSQDKHKIEEEAGDLLFAIVNLMRHLELKSEVTLQKANRKFESRFKQVETILKEKKIDLSNATLDEMESAWQSVKNNEK